MIDNCADDWRIAMTWQRMMLIGVEIAICAVHPVPGRYYFLWTTKLSNHGGKIGSQWVPVDVTLSLPMFFRLYLICSEFKLHYTSNRERGVVKLNEKINCAMPMFRHINEDDWGAFCLLPRLVGLLVPSAFSAQ